MPKTPNPMVRRFYAASPFADTPLRRAISAACRVDEPDAVLRLLVDAQLSELVSANATRLAEALVTRLRASKNADSKGALVQALLREYSLSSEEGIALMCLAEALLRIPDAATRDRLIRDKIAGAKWREHLGQSHSLYVNAATWGLLIAGGITAGHTAQGLGAALRRLVKSGGEPLIRKATDLAMRMMGAQFVTGETIAAALANSRTRESTGFRYSFDMLGEAALTHADAQRYCAEYESAIHAIGRAAGGRGPYAGPGISIKLSALHPRYSRSQYTRVMDELFPRVLQLCALAKQYNIGLNIDAEESERLELSLDLLERLCVDPGLAQWNGLGFVIQAYQKRCPFVVDYLVELARRGGRRLMVRLVKGAYWDAEIKRAQVDGQDGFPVYTRKVHTDIAYVACARKLLAAPDAIYPQFATHNAQTLATIYHLADPERYCDGQYEFQCLHGMGEPLYDLIVGSPADGKLSRPCRIYAPVGTHETLLAYLVRRLLENGANSSFVNRIANPAVPISALVADPVSSLLNARLHGESVGSPHPSIRLPRNLYMPERANSRGLDLSCESELARIDGMLQEDARIAWSAPFLVADERSADAPALEIKNPGNRRDIVGLADETPREVVERALADAHAGAPSWASTPPSERARCLEQAANILERDTLRLLGLLMREAGKTAPNAVAEVREAVDFLRYYSAHVRNHFVNATHKPLGAVVCISPWNFPLAIFMGQVAAALAAGNTVLAKPAEQTPLIAAEAVRVLWSAGVPRFAVQLLPGRGETVGAQLVADPRVNAVLFTGSTDVARTLQCNLAGRVGPLGGAVPLIAETGGQNALIADSSALTEQVVADALASAFDSAGQRCSALRILCVQEDVADRTLKMLSEAMHELVIGPSDCFAVDVGPVIDEDARRNLEAHVEQMRSRGFKVVQAVLDHGVRAAGTYFPPTLIEIGSVADLGGEIFGPVLHFLRYDARYLQRLVADIANTGYGLTFGLHTRIDDTVETVISQARAGNIYINRNIVGAVVGVQPFGGEGLSGTGPKAGGPLYLYRLLAGHPEDSLARIFSARSASPNLPDKRSDAADALLAWLSTSRPAFAERLRVAGTYTGFPRSMQLPGPTGETNTYSLAPRNTILCLATTDDDRLVQLRAVLAAGATALWPQSAGTLKDKLPRDIREHVKLTDDWRSADTAFDLVLLHGSPKEMGCVQQFLATRPGPVVSVERAIPGATEIPLERLLVERAVSINTTAAGGNASLMTVDY